MNYGGMNCWPQMNARGIPVWASESLDRVGTWARAHRASVIALGGALIVITVAMTWNLQGWPGRVDEDEGTYVAEAWAMIYAHHLAPYTYWYDHPPLGWAQIAAYLWLTDGLARYASAVMAGREFMVVVTLVSVVILYVLCRRLDFRVATATVTVLAYGLSPIAVYYHRMVSLDNLGTVWLLAAMAVAASRKRNLSVAFWSGVCSTVAVLTKETIALLLPVVFWMLWRRSEPHVRKWHLSIYASTIMLFCAFYPLYAALRGELFPGSGHVSLIWAMYWQLAGRAGSGFIGAGGTAAHGLLLLWLGTDRWLLCAGLALVPTGFLFGRLRPFAFGLLFQAVMAVHGGYLPYFYVTAMIPFAALLIGGVADTLWEPVSWRWLTYAGRLLVLAAGVAAVFVVLPQWGSALVRQAGVNGDASSLAATAWVERNVPHGALVVVDDYLWPDLKRAGFSPLWMQKTSSDLEAQGALPDGWRSIDYVVESDQIVPLLGQLPILQQAVDRSVPVATFGTGNQRVVVLRVGNTLTADR
jgi:4-amino-4-deoxy-L-arabinose transferase-like glycosyltransferase